MAKTVYQIIQEKHINNWKDLLDFLDGKRARVVGRTDGNNYSETFKISIKFNYAGTRNNMTPVIFAPTTSISDISKGKTSNGIYLQNFTIENASIEELKKEREELEKEFFKSKGELDEKIELLEKFDLDEYDELMLKAHKIYKNLNLETREQFQQVYKSLL